MILIAQSKQLFDQILFFITRISTGNEVSRYRHHLFEALQIQHLELGVVQGESLENETIIFEVKK